MVLPLIAGGAMAYGASRVPGATHFVPIDEHEQEDQPKQADPSRPSPASSCSCWPTGDPRPTPTA